MFSPRSTSSVIASTLFVLIFTAGCAKKTKPDQEAIAPSQVLGSGSVQDKDMNYEATGSDTGKIEGLSSVHFAYDQATLDQESRNLLVKDAQWLKKHKEKNLQIEGHCDRHGSIEYNLALGQRRANTVKKYLLNLGIKSDRLSTISYGKEKLLDSAETEEADAKNRRANFKPVDAPSNHVSKL